MIVIASKPGQLGNRLFMFAHLIAFAIEHSVKVADPAFDDFAPLYRGTREDFFCRYPARRSWVVWSHARRPWYWLVNRCAAVVARFTAIWRWLDVERIDWWQVCDLTEPEWITRVRSRKVVFLQGWLFDAEAYLTRHGDEVRDFLTPTDGIIHEAEGVLREIRDRADLLVGVHIRHGDYRHFLDGRYLFELSVFTRLMKETQALFPDKRVGFFVSSDESQPSAELTKFDCVFGGRSSAVDLHCFASCDYLVGPPSTFTLWASFYGKVPLAMVTESSHPLELADFEISRSQMRFPEIARAGAAG